MDKITYNVKEISDMLGIGMSAAYQLVKSNGFPSLRVGKRIVIPAQAFSSWLNDSAHHDYWKGEN